MKREFTYGLEGYPISRTNDVSAVNNYHVFAGKECLRVTIFLSFS
jgi:hypothetical protein